MNCQNHPDISATAYCRTCGKPVCDECRRDAIGTVYCAEHVPAAAPPPPPPQPSAAPPQSAYAPPVAYANPSISPGLAFLLGFIPGVGAIYNGQYAKGLVHAVIFGILVSILDSNVSPQPVFAMLLTAWIFYMVFEAYHTARKRRLGEPVDEYSSLVTFGGKKNAPAAGIVLVALGAVLLLNTLNIFDFAYLARYWPVLLIVAGVYLLATRMSGNDTPGGN